MIFDLPPMLVSDDTTAFLKNVDCVLLIAGAEISTISQVDACEREIAEHTNVLGVVLNKCRFHEEESGHAYGEY
jgi:Mrp family chromosome partitioning ATPase